MMQYWPFWLGGGSLATILVGHWLVLGRMMAVSGRYTAIVNRFRHGHGKEPQEEMNSAELVAALEAATLDAFGEEAIREMAAKAEPRPAPADTVTTAPPQTHGVHLVFLLFLMAGGFLSALLSGRFAPQFGLRSELLPRLLGHSLSMQVLVLFGGGILVGIGTRMAGGCTSGHGLCGTSRFQRGSFLATAAFFGAGVTLSLLLKGFFHL